MKTPILGLSALALLVSGCAGKGEIVEGGITAVRSACPTVGVPAGTGDVTLFNPATSRDASAIDVSATISNVRSTCNDAGDDIVTGVTFDVRARRTRADAARDVSLPYYVAIVRGGNNVVAKRLGTVALHFDAGTVHVDAWQDMADELIIEELVAIRGIGRWTAEMFLIFHLLRPNVLPLDDLGLINGISTNYFSGDPVSRSDAREVAVAWAPFCSVATWYIWRSLEPLPVAY